MAKLMIVLGTLLVLGGLLLFVAARVGLPLGRLPGDLAWRGRYGAIFLPLGTSLLLSLLLSALLWILGRFRR